MKEVFNKIRTPDITMKASKEIVNTILIFLLGIILGILSKWLDNLGMNDSILWQQIIGKLDFNNVLSGFAIWLFIALAC